ncbi:MAG: hypothetical protein Q9181_002745 [Wetmoreana brouardii]
MSQPWDYIAKLVCIGDSGTGKSSLTIRLCEGRFVPHHDVTIGVEFGSRIVSVGPPLPKKFPSSPNPNHQRNPSSHHQKQNPQHEGDEDDEDGRQRRRKRMKLSLWDTAGQETYKSITRSYFRGASGALLVYDITRRSTFEHATEWLTDLRQIAEEGIVVILVGNKSDLASSSTVSPSSSSTLPNGSAPHKNTNAKNRRAVTKEEAEEWCRRNGVLKYVETSAKSGDGVEAAFLEVAERIYQNIEAGRYDLNDRRSGVKSYGTGTGRDVSAKQSVNLSLNDAVKGKTGGGCC